MARNLQNMNVSVKRFAVPVSLGVALLLSSCSLLAPAVRPGILDMSIDTMENGHLIEIRVDRPVGSVSAFVTRAHWLVVTIVDSLLDASALESSTSSLIDTLETTQFPTALQLAFHLTIEVDAVEVIHADPSSRVLISLFAKREGEGEKRQGDVP